jgi:predicted ATP-dependent serine protease
MSLEAIKIDLAKQLFNVNKKTVLEQIRKILENEKTDSFTIDGLQLTIAEYNKELEKAEKEIKEGKTLSTEELAKEIKSWRK